MLKKASSCNSLELFTHTHTQGHTISTSPQIDTYTHTHKHTYAIPAHENIFGIENKMTIYPKGGVFSTLLPHYKGDFPWPKSEKVSELFISYRVISIVRILQIVLHVN